MHKQSIYDLSFTELNNFIVSIGEQRFRTQQIFSWLYIKQVASWTEMTNLSQALIAQLDQKFDLDLPTIKQIDQSQDQSIKFLLETHDGKLIESILMFVGDRTTICVSCMIGCPLKCKFCATGSQIGFVRNLTPSEIIGQFIAISRYGRTKISSDFRITNIVFMGMGEPLINRAHVERSIELLTDRAACALSPSRITVSTAGVASAIADFFTKYPVNCAVSLHFPNDELRSRYMPVNTAYPLALLIEELGKIPLSKRDYITIEYLMLRNINDTIEHAKQLIQLVAGLKVKINLIPYNPTATLPEQPSTSQQLDKFAQYLTKRGLTVTVRHSKGTDIEGGCGQFALKMKERS